MLQAAVGYLFSEEVTAAIDRYSREVADAVVEKAQKLCTLYGKVLKLEMQIANISALLAIASSKQISFLTADGMAIWWLQEEGEGDHEMKVEVKVAVWDARTVICQMADKLGADLLVMGSHGYGFFKRYPTQQRLVAPATRAQ